MQGAAAFFLASSGNGEAACAGGAAGAGACWAQATPPANPASAAKKDILASLRKRVRLPTVRLEAYHFLPTQLTTRNLPAHGTKKAGRFRVPLCVASTLSW